MPLFPNPTSLLPNLTERWVGGEKMHVVSPVLAPALQSTSQQGLIYVPIIAVEGMDVNKLVPSDAIRLDDTNGLMPAEKIRSHDLNVPIPLMMSYNDCP